jgi:hypothetical protein
MPVNRSQKPPLDFEAARRAIARLSPAERDALDLLAVGIEGPGADGLLERSLVERTEDGVVIPLPVHLAWARTCAEDDVRKVA